MSEIVQHIKDQTNGHFALTYDTLDNAIHDVANKYADAMGCEPDEAARLMHHHFMMRLRSGAINPEIDENIADAGSAGEVNADGAVMERNMVKPQLMKKYYFNVHGTPRIELSKLGLHADYGSNDEWVLLRYNTSGMGFDRQYSTCVRCFGQPYKVETAK